MAEDVQERAEVGGLNFSQAAAGRSQAYALLRDAFNALPDAATLRRLAFSPLLDAAASDDSTGQEALVALRAVLRDVADGSSIISTIGVERTRLLRGIRPGQGLPPACESVYRDDVQSAAAEFDKCRLLLEPYERAGFAADPAVPADFVGNELGFLAFLADREAEAWRSDDHCCALALAEDQLAYLDRHLGAWIEPLRRRVCSEPSSGFWPALLVLAETHVRQEREYLQQLIRS